jgi:putative FmdB family regulatory protein
MRKLFDYGCAACGHEFEALVEGDNEIECPECHESPATRRATGGHIFTVITATSLTSKRYKAGYVHNFQKRPAEKISMQVPAGPKSE